MFATTSSIRPRVFIKMPIDHASRRDSPCAAAAIPASADLSRRSPRVITTPHRATRAPARRSIRHPLAGPCRRKTPAETSPASSAAAARSALREPRSSARSAMPARNAPKMPDSPSALVAAAPSSITTSAAVMVPPPLAAAPGLSTRAHRCCTTGGPRRSSRDAKMTVPGEPRRSSPTMLNCACTNAVTAASIVHPATSSSAAAVVVSAAIRVPCRFRSSRMRASVGIAVIDTAVPTNNRKPIGSTSEWRAARCRTSASSKTEHERHDDAGERNGERGALAHADLVERRDRARPGTAAGPARPRSARGRWLPTRPER